MTYLDRSIVIINMCKALAGLDDISLTHHRYTAYNDAGIDPSHIELYDADVWSTETIRRKLFKI